MTRLDDLINLRRQINAEIERERASELRIAELRGQVFGVSIRGTWGEKAVAASCAHHCVDVLEVRAGRRGASVVDARHVAMWLMRDAGQSYPEIGAELGMDHTSAIHGVKRVESTERLLAAAHAVRQRLTGEAAA